MSSNRNEEISWLMTCAITFMICGILYVLLLPRQRMASSGGTRSECKNNLKQLGLAAHNYHDLHGHFPLPHGQHAQNTPPYSWRVALLPLLENQALYDRYDFSEAWDAPANQPLQQISLQNYLCPTTSREMEDSKRTVTDYVVAIDDEAIFTLGDPTSVAGVTDGTSQTLLFGELADSNIHWSEPRDLPMKAMSFRLNQSKESFSSPHTGGAQFTFADGSVHFLSDETEPDVLRALLTKSGGEEIGEF